MRKKILVIDDDARLREAVSSFLAPYGYDARSLPDGEGLLRELETNRPHLVLLDVMLPGDDGFTILQRLRTVSSVPVLILTAKDENVDRIVGLEMGADDYLAKPFNPRELAARIKAILRRSSLAAAFKSMPCDFLHYGSFTLDVKNKTLLHEERAAALSETEFLIVRAFMTNSSSTLSRDQLLTLVFGEEFCANDRLIDVHISRIRRVLRELGATPCPIKTIWGQGYRWVVAESV